MNVVLEAAREIFDWLEQQHIPACLIGGLAVQRWGEPRFTRDVDVTVLAPYGSEETIIAACLSRFQPRIPDVQRFALDHRILLLTASNGVPLDLALGAIDFEIEAVERASPYEFASGVVVRTCSAEDLIIHKAVAGRPQDLVDVKGIVARQLGGLDLERIRHWIRIMSELKEDPDMVAQFEAIVRQARAARQT